MPGKGISLHIGLNAVHPDNYSGWSGPLAACEADAEDMLDIAKRIGYSSKILLTSDATRQAVIDAIRSAAGTLVSGDTFFLTYSGHGGQLPDRNDDEADGEDETWCLFDGQIVDDELSRLYGEFAAGVRILILSDSCHSGTVAKLRAFGLPNDANGDGSTNYRFLPPDPAKRAYRRNRDFYDPILDLPAPKPVKASILLLSGCQDNQYSADGTFNGLFTGTLLRVWKDGQFNGDYRQFHRQIVNRMPPQQTPNLFPAGTPDPAFLAQKPFSL